MTTTDPIADMLARIRNAIAVGKNEIRLPHSKIKENVAEILKSATFIHGLEVGDATVGKTLKITINQSGSNPRITDIKRLSKPGRRQYTSVEQIPTIRSGRGIVIISTSKGIMTGTQAKASRLGGELICRVY